MRCEEGLSGRRGAAEGRRGAQRMGVMCKGRPGPNKARRLCVRKGIGLPRLLNTEERLRTQKGRMMRCEWEPCVPDHIRVLKLGDGLSSE